MGTSTEIETPEVMAARVLREAIEAESPGPRNKPNAHNCIVAGVVADREQIAAHIEAIFARHGSDGSDRDDLDEIRALAAILRGTK